MSSAGSGNFVYTLQIQLKGQDQIQAGQRVLDQFYSTLGRGAAENKKFSDAFVQGANGIQQSTTVRIVELVR